MISVFDVFKIGIGPSSSHTVGPMNAAYQFISDLNAKKIINSITALKVYLYGSLSLTGRGHATDVAIIMGLAGNKPETVYIEGIAQFIADLALSKQLYLATGPEAIAFDIERDIVFEKQYLPLHENGMKIVALAGENIIYQQSYYSIGGGFIVDEDSFHIQQAEDVKEPFLFNSSLDLLALSKQHQLSLPEIIWRNELSYKSETDIVNQLKIIWKVMQDAIVNGMQTEGFLPGPFKVKRRAAVITKALSASNNLNSDPMQIIDWVNVYAFAVGEENAAGGRVVTAPTNGACGIVPAVLSYYQKFINPVGDEELKTFFLTATAICILYKKNASISGAEVGCQGEVGVASSIAAAGLTALLGGTIEQIFSSAEIAMEHHLGLTCDPIGGLVQVPCIERNAISAVKAINASRMALLRDKQAKDSVVNLDVVISSMYETGKDMNVKYRETSLGGLAIKVLPCS